MAWRRKWQPTPVFLPRKSCEREAWWVTVHGVTKELDTTERLHNRNIILVHVMDPTLSWCTQGPRGKKEDNCFHMMNNELFYIFITRESLVERELDSNSLKWFIFSNSKDHYLCSIFNQKLSCTVI